MTNLEKLIGKKIIRTVMCECPYGDDYSFCLNGKFGKQPDKWVTLIGITKNNEIKYRDHEPIFGLNVRTLEPYWNDGNWREYDPVQQEITTPVFVQERFGRFEGII
jgi:hypothetical protein